MDKKKAKKILGVSCVALGTAFIGLNMVAKKKKADSIYENEPEEKNELEGKRVIFVEDESYKENADGVRGYLKEIGESNYKPSFYDKYVKRSIDVVLSFGGLVVLSPVMVTIALAIKMEDPGPVLFTQKRMGQNKQYFKLHKFRSMKMDTPHDVPTHQLENPDQYITKVGKFIRAHSLDELPQIWDIFIGNMSVIGPRPGLWNQDLLTAERDKYNANDIKPGLTGWAQINGRDELEIPVKAKLDGEYVKNESLLFDAKCFLGTVSKVGHDDSVVEGGTGEMAKTVGRDYTSNKSDSELIGNIGFGEPVKVDTDKNVKVLIIGKGSYIGESFKTYANKNYTTNFEIDEVDTINPDWKDVDFSVYDIVYHVAGIAHADVGNVSNEVKEKYYKINTDLAIQVAEKAKNEGVKEFIFMSSMIVYGDSAPYGTTKIIDKNTIPCPANFYGDSKLQADVAVRELADDNFKVIVLRPPMIYGKGSKGNYPLLAKLAKTSPVFPNIENQRSMLHIDNLCEFLCQIMLVDVKQNATVLIPQNSEWTKTSDMVREIAKVSNTKTIVTKLFNPCVYIAHKIPGKINGLVDKAFGNNCYEFLISNYDGINYNINDFTESIFKTENEWKTKKKDNKLMNLNDKKVLLIALSGYSDGMINKMEQLGAKVDYIHDKPNEKFLTKSLGRIGFKFYQKILEKYYREALKPLKKKNYDFILVIRGEYTPEKTLKYLKQLYPNSKLILYMWDGLNKQNTRGIQNKWIFFDKVYTFDRFDYETNKGKIDFLPLYYYDKYLPKDIKSANSDDLEYDISFIGTGHDDRINVINNIMHQAEKCGLKCFKYYYMPHKLIYLKNKLLNKSFKTVSHQDLKYSMIPFEDLYKIYSNSKCIVDVENKGQHGLTMRTIEILGLKRKLITTNKDIVNYDFYNSNNILVIDRDNPKFDISFIEKPYIELKEEIYKKYSLENWILEILK